MLTANKSNWFDSVFAVYNEYYLIRRHFHAVYVSGRLDHGRGGQLPVLYTMNHSSWWDGLMIYTMTQRCSQADHYVMMEHRQLMKYSFFRKLGAYSIDSSSTAAIRASIRYTAELLKEGKRVWMFPQGEIRHLEHRPLQFRPGVGAILRLVPNTAVIPVTMFHGLQRHDTPVAAIHIGEPITAAWQEYDSRAIAAILEARTLEQLNTQRARITVSETDDLEGYEPIFTPRASINEVFDAFKRHFGRKNDGHL